MDRASEGFSHGERLLLRTIRMLALQADCRGQRCCFEAACGCAGEEAYRTLEVFVEQLRLNGQRRIAISAPPIQDPHRRRTEPAGRLRRGPERRLPRAGRAPGRPHGHPAGGLAGRRGLPGGPGVRHAGAGDLRRTPLGRGGVVVSSLLFRGGTAASRPGWGTGAQAPALQLDPVTPTRPELRSVHPPLKRRNGISSCALSGPRRSARRSSGRRRRRPRGRARWRARTSGACSRRRSRPWNRAPRRPAAAGARPR